MKPTHIISRVTPALLSVVGLAACLLQGCSDGLGTPSATLPVKTSITLKGHAHGGQQPVSGATIQLYAVGTTGLQSASTPLVAATVTTGSDGGFNLAGDWNCTSNTATYGVNPELYLVATGGNPGLNPGTSNQALAMMVALGPCSSVTSATVVWVNEITTVAAVYALAPFMADLTHIGASSAQQTGLANAFQLATVLADPSTGIAPGPSLPSNATAPAVEINSLGNLIAPCINSSGTDSSCQQLFAAATPASGNAPADTASALVNIAHNPGNNVTALFNIIPTTTPFQPAMTSAPNDWTVALRFTGGGLNAPAALALDAGGNAWIANGGGNSVTELSPVGTPLTGSSGYTAGGNLLGAQGIAVDKAGNVWVADTLLSSVVELTMSGGAIQSNASFTNGGISGPMGIAIDSQNNVWIANAAGSSISELNSSGSALGGSPLTASGTLQAPSGIAIDSVGRVWVTDNLASDVVEFGNDQSLLSGAGDTDGAILGPQGIAIDGGGRAWVAYQGTGAASYFVNGLNSVASSSYTGGGLSLPSAVAIDGANNAWVTNDQAHGTLTEMNAGQSTPLSRPPASAR